MKVEAVQENQGEPVERMFSFFPYHYLLLMIKLITCQKSILSEIIIYRKV